MENLRVRPMTASEFDTFRARLITGYAADHVRAGDWPVAGAEELAAREVDQLLPNGVETPGMLVLSAETATGELVGHVWVALEFRPGSDSGGWIYDIEVASHQRGRGYGRALLRAAEDEAARNGVAVIGLNVFGVNATARRLYESAGYEVTSLQMRKQLLPPA